MLAQRGVHDGLISGVAGYLHVACRGEALHGHFRACQWVVHGYGAQQAAVVQDLNHQLRVLPVSRSQVQVDAAFAQACGIVMAFGQKLQAGQGHVPRQSRGQGHAVAD